MPGLLRHLAIAAALGTTATIIVFLLGVTLSPFPIPLLALSLLVSPAHVLFIATAACDPFDTCSLITLLWAVAINAALYAAIALCLWFTKVRLPGARPLLLAGLALSSVLWLRLWF